MDQQRQHQQGQSASPESLIGVKGISSCSDIVMLGEGNDLHGPLPRSSNSYPNFSTPPCRSSGIRNGEVPCGALRGGGYTLTGESPGGGGRGFCDLTDNGDSGGSPFHPDHAPKLSREIMPLGVTSDLKVKAQENGGSGGGVGGWKGLPSSDFSLRQQRQMQYVLHNSRLSSPSLKSKKEESKKQANTRAKARMLKRGALFGFTHSESTTSSVDAERVSFSESLVGSAVEASKWSLGYVQEDSIGAHIEGSDLSLGGPVDIPGKRGDIVRERLHQVQSYSGTRRLILRDLNLTRKEVPVESICSPRLGRMLCKLSLAGNRLDTVPERIVMELIGLRTLDLSQCGLVSVPEVWNLMELRRLNLSHNRLKTFLPEVCEIQGRRAML